MHKNAPKSVEESEKKKKMESLIWLFIDTSLGSKNAEEENSN